MNIQQAGALGGVDFCRALDALCGYRSVTRRSWGGKRWLMLVSDSYVTRLEAVGAVERPRFLIEPFFVEWTVRGTFAVWRPTDEDMLATDWEVMI